MVNVTNILNMGKRRGQSACLGFELYCYNKKMSIFNWECSLVYMLSKQNKQTNKKIREAARLLFAMGEQKKLLEAYSPSVHLSEN